MAKREKEELLEIRVEVTLQYGVTSAHRRKILPKVQEALHVLTQELKRLEREGEMPARLIHSKETGWTNENDPEMGLIETIDRIRELRRQAAEEESGLDYDPENYVRKRIDALLGEARDLAKKLHEKTGWIE
jgi:hypothetical protein